MWKWKHPPRREEADQPLAERLEEVTAKLESVVRKLSVRVCEIDKNIDERGVQQ